ncbi:hypothetical protein B0T25DRAFT_574588 [Lasiosphaeria hispida]|uniref:Ankyrin repeat protein n=1 Tax=Lasiosphaeria hispida TaxID=260671 RepID=A0AAJ0H5K8_9PEZI|nr:hypothetical protein B0T25DRAFT_574588 [Lasiosphaeria hispida]
MAQDIHAVGLGSLEDVYLCIIPPLSLTKRLPPAYSVVDWARQHVQPRNIALHWAGFYWDEEIFDHLPLTNPDLRTVSGRTVLHQAAVGGNRASARLQKMLDKGYDATAKGQDGRMALQYSAWKGDAVGVRTLWEKTNVEDEDRLGMRPVNIAASRGHDELAIELFSGNADMDVDMMQKRRNHQDQKGSSHAPRSNRKLSNAA